MEIKEFLYFSLISLTILSFFIFIVKQSNNRKKELFIEKFADYMTTLEFFEDKAYEIIYKDRLLIYSLEATKIDDDKFHVISKDFSKLVFRLMGEPLFNEYIKVLGQDALSLNLVEYFNRRYEDDEIRKESVNQMMNKPLEEQKWVIY